MLAISAAEFLATGSRSTRWFQGLFGGNTGQPCAPGSAWADVSAGTAIAAISDRHARATATRRTAQETTAMPLGVTPNTASSTSPRKSPSTWSGSGRSSRELTLSPCTPEKERT